MKHLNQLKWASVLAITTSASWAVGELASSEEVNLLGSNKEKVSYAIGARYGQGLKRQVGDLDLSMFIRGLKDAHVGEPLMLQEEEIVQLITRYKQDRITEVREAKEAVASNNKTKADRYLKENKAKEGVITVKSGLQYKVLKEGLGPMPKLTDTVRVHYHGTLVDGTVFDSSVNRGESITFRVNGVIKGWAEALQLMSVGSKWQLFIPPELAYGSENSTGAIEPNSALIFDVELIAIEP